MQLRRAGVRAVPVSAPPTEELAEPFNIVLSDVTNDEREEVVYTGQGFVFHLSLTSSGATAGLENFGDDLFTVEAGTLQADCVGAAVWFLLGIAPRRSQTLQARCTDGKVPTAATLELRSLISSAPDIGFALPDTGNIGQAAISFSNYPAELFGGDGSRVSTHRVGPNTLSGMFTNGTSHVVEAHLALASVCPDVRFDEPTLADTGARAVHPGETLTITASCKNGPPAVVVTAGWKPMEGEVNDGPR